MPHGHRSSNRAHDEIEDTIERLLRKGAEISDVLEKEVKYAENKYAAEPRRSCVTACGRDSASVTSALSRHSHLPSAHLHRTPRELPMESSSESFSSYRDATSVQTSQVTIASSHAISKMHLPLRNLQEDIGVIDPKTTGIVPKGDGDVTNDAMPNPGDLFLGVKFFPCFIRDGNGKTVERTAKVAFHRRAESHWLVLIYEVSDVDNRPLLALRTELLGRLMRNTYINGNRVE